VTVIGGDAFLSWDVTLRVSVEETDGICDSFEMILFDSLLCEDPNSLLFETTFSFDDENDFIVNK
jgi:hypothetical protein